MQLWGLEKESTGNYATDYHGPLSESQSDELERWIAAAPPGRTRSKVDQTMGELVRDGLEHWGGKFLLPN